MKKAPSWTPRAIIEAIVRTGKKYALREPFRDHDVLIRVREGGIVELSLRSEARVAIDDLDDKQEPLDPMKKPQNARRARVLGEVIPETGEGLSKKRILTRFKQKCPTDQIEEGTLKQLLTLMSKQNPPLAHFEGKGAAIRWWRGPKRSH